jgi:hypothetical protein
MNWLSLRRVYKFHVNLDFRENEPPSCLRQETEGARATEHQLQDGIDDVERGDIVLAIPQPAQA